MALCAETEPTGGGFIESGKPKRAVGNVWSLGCPGVRAQMETQDLPTHKSDNPHLVMMEGEEGAPWISVGNTEPLNLLNCFQTYELPFFLGTKMDASLLSLADNSKAVKDHRGSLRDNLDMGAQGESPRPTLLGQHPHNSPEENTQEKKVLETGERIQQGKGNGLRSKMLLRQGKYPLAFQQG